MNKKGDFESIIYFIAVIFVAGVILVFMNYLFNNINTEMETALTANNDSIIVANATASLSKVRATENNIWDYGFLFILVGYIFAIGLASFYQQTNPFFFWFNIILSSFGILLSIVFGYTWNVMAETPALSEVIERFPITNFLLGSYYPLIVIFVIVLTVILLYGKDSGGNK